MRIRKFKAEDAAEVARLHRGTIRHINKRDYTPRQITVWSGKVSAKRLRESMSRINRFVAIEGKKIVGFGDYSPGKGLAGLYVHKDFQRKGIGKRLLKKLEKEAFRDGLKEIYISATITSKDFYKSNGYKVIRKGHYTIGDQKYLIYCMKKKL